MLNLTQLHSKLRVIKQYGLKYSFERGSYALKVALNTKFFFNKIQLPASIGKIEWIKQKSAFIIEAREDIQPHQQDGTHLKNKVENIFAGNYPYFQTLEFEIETKNKWHYNPITGKNYSKSIHWSKISDFSSSEGDIKFVWELSRFCYLYPIMRYDFHYKENSSEFVFKEILEWIEENPNDRGPNYMSSQEIALRLLNWIYVLHFYKDSEFLTDEKFNLISNSIFLQTKHIEKELQFSKKFVRNNHLLTEALALYTIGLIFPHFEESEKRKHKGFSIFCNEIVFQFDEDGAYLQHSLNYQRVAMQLSTWFLCLNKQNNLSIPETVLSRLKKAVQFMLNMMGDINKGRLPQFGNNDGSLFFPFNDLPGSNYHPQIQALANVLEIQIGNFQYEDSYWFKNKNDFENTLQTQHGIINYNSTGYYIIQEKDTMTFLWCPDFKHRPAQADMLHCDIWYQGENILRDNGTYLYNTTDALRKFFFGSKSHNSLLVDGNDLMEKGERFIFFHHPQKIDAGGLENEKEYVLNASMEFYPQTKNKFIITRKIAKTKVAPHWEIQDIIQFANGKLWTQVWNINENFFDEFLIEATDAQKMPIQPKIIDSFTSDDYGHIKSTRQIHISSTTHLINTLIRKK